MSRRLLVLLAAPLLTGCGTMSNMQGKSFALIGPRDRESRAFGGVANDVRWVGEQAERVVSPDDPWSIPTNLTLACYFGLVDLPLSLVGDIVTLPKVVWGRGKPQRPAARNAEPGAAADPARLSAPVTPGCHGGPGS